MSSPYCDKLTNKLYNKCKTRTQQLHNILINPQKVHKKLLLYPFNGLFSRTTWVSRYQKDKTSLDLSDARDDKVLGWQWHQLDRMQTVFALLQTDNHTNTSSLIFYRPDALPDTQTTVSKH